MSENRGLFVRISSHGKSRLAVSTPRSAIALTFTDSGIAVRIGLKNCEATSWPRVRYIPQHRPL